MNLSKIHHIAIIVSDYEAAKDFYVNKLGFSVIRENYRPERKDWKLDLRVNEYTELEIFAEENPPKRVNRPEASVSPLSFCAYTDFFFFCTWEKYTPFLYGRYEVTEALES